MTNFIQTLQTDESKSLFQKHRLSYVGVFGSTARNEATDQSDVDLLIDFRDAKSLFDVARIKIDLEKAFGKKFDLSFRGSLKKSLEPYILRDLETIYEQN